MKWSKEKPTEVGNYKAKCFESDHEEYDVKLFLRFGPIN